MADYGCFPLWWTDGRIGNIDPATLPLSPDLVAGLLAWAAALDRTLNQDYPPESGFATLAEANAFEAEGARLCDSLRAQLGDLHTVVYRRPVRSVWGTRS